MRTILAVCAVAVVACGCASVKLGKVEKMVLPETYKPTAGVAFRVQADVDLTDKSLKEVRDRLGTDKTSAVLLMGVDKE